MAESVSENSPVPEQVIPREVHTALLVSLFQIRHEKVCHVPSSQNVFPLNPWCSACSLLLSFCSGLRLYLYPAGHFLSITWDPSPGLIKLSGHSSQQCHLPLPIPFSLGTPVLVYPVIKFRRLLCHFLTSPVAQSLTSPVTLGESLNLRRRIMALNQSQRRVTIVGPGVFL